MMRMALACALALAGCSPKLTFTCSNDAQCGPPMGACVAGGCAFPDSTCASGYRYDKSAPALASECTDRRDPVDGGGTDGPAGCTGTDVGCGGTCPPCAVGMKCLVNGDCASMMCDPASQQCAASPQCTSTTCGGGICPPCALGKKCSVAADCASMICYQMICVDQCHDGVKDGDETDIDCGGSCPTKCRATQSCSVVTDCNSGICTGGFCVPASGPPSWSKVLDITGAPPAYSSSALGPDGKIYVVGGCFNSNYTTGCTGQSLSAYVPSLNSYQSGLPSMPTGRAMPGFTAGQDGRLYAIGGGTASAFSPQSTVVEAYDVGSKTWSSSYPALPLPRSSAPAVLAPNGTIYYAGGYEDGAQTNSRSDLQGFTQAHSWMSPPPAGMPDSRWMHAGALGNDGRIYLFGGRCNTPGCGGIPQMAELIAYVPTTDSWTQPSALTKMPTARAALGGAPGADGRVYAVGGTADFASFLSTVEAYTPKTNAWATMPPLNYRGAFVNVVAGADGRLYAIGGVVGFNNMATDYRALIEAYGPTVSLGATSGAAGAAVSLTGSNFAANAKVSIYFGSATAPVGSGTTDGAGKLPSASFIVPSVASGAYKLTVVDVRSEYPAYATFTVP